MIYFIHDRLSHAVKIGTADDPQKRLRLLQCGCPNPLELLAVLPGDRHDEEELHHRWRAVRLGGEWFRATDELMEFIRSTESKHMGPFMKLVELEPGLMDLYREAKRHHEVAGSRFRANAARFGYAGYRDRGIKSRLIELVGWYREGSDPLLETKEAYEIAYEMIYRALPDCRKGCACQVVLEALS